VSQTSPPPTRPLDFQLDPGHSLSWKLPYAALAAGDLAAAAPSFLLSGPIGWPTSRLWPQTIKELALRRRDAIWSIRPYDACQEPPPGADRETTGGRHKGYAGCREAEIVSALTRTAADFPQRGYRKPRLSHSAAVLPSAAPRTTGQASA